MKLTFSTRGWNDYLEWQELDRRMLKRINGMISEIMRDPYHGIGKPEPLKHELSGFWSRRIDTEHRLVYRATEDAILIAQCRYHY